MFHSAGYFRGVSCPFFQHGLCHRPHCHYRHRSATPKPRALLKKLPQLRTRSIPAPTEQEKSPTHSKTEGCKESKPKAEERKTVQAKLVEALKTKPEGDGHTQPPGETCSQDKDSEPSTLVKQAIGAITNFYGSVNPGEGPSIQVNIGGRVEEPGIADAQESHPSIAEGTIEIVSPPDISGEQIALTVTAEVPSYAPERCIAGESRYSVEDSQETAAFMPTDTAGVKMKVEETTPDVAMATERDIFGSPDKDVCDAGYGYDDPHEGLGDGDAFEEVKSEQELASIEAAFVKATTALQSQSEDRKCKAESRKRKSAESDTSVKKKRLAHSTEPVMRESVSLQSKPRVTSNFAAALDAGALYMGKKRTAVPSDQFPATKRPVLPLTPNAKIPTKLRQRFLNSFIDEYLIITADAKEAYEKALSEEQRLFDHSSRRMLYLNLSTIALKKLREEAKCVTQERRERSDARVEAGAKSPGTPKSPVKRGGEAGGKNRKERVELATSPKKLKKRHKVESRDGGEGSTKELYTEQPMKTGVSAHGKHRKNLSPPVSFPAPSYQLDSPNFPEMCKRMELKLTRCEVSSSCSSSGDEALFKTSQFYSHDELKNQNLKSLKRQPSKSAAAVVQSKKEELGRGTDFKTKKVKKDRTSHTGSLKSSVQVDRTPDGERRRSMHGERNKTHSEVKPDISVEETDLVTELFGDSPVSDHDEVWFSSESEKEGMSFESALSAVDNPTRKPVLKRRHHSHRQKTSSHAYGNGHKKLKLSSGATKSKSVQRPVSVQDVSVEAKSPAESKPQNPQTQVTKSDRASFPSFTHLVDTSETGMVEKRHSDVRTMKRKLSEVMSPLGAKSPPLLTSPGAENPGPSHQPLPGPLINLTKLAAEQSRKKTLVPLSSRKHSRSSAGSDRKPSRQIHSKPSQVHSKPSQKPSYTIFRKKEVVLTAPLFHSQMRAYVLTEDQLVENGYPRPTAEVGVAMIHWREGEAPPEIQPVGPNAMRHRCCRCSKPFIIYNSGQYQTVEECVYHYGRLIKSREYGEGVVSLYTCCQERRDSMGCQVAKMHVTSGTRPSRDSGYVQTLPPLPSKDGNQPSVYALDCEMCYTTAGLQLTRVSVVDMELSPVYESLVRPSHPIVDYNTRFSGLTAEQFVGVQTTLEDVQQQLLHLFHSDTILLGHSLESDMRALKLVHSCVVDTAIVFPHRKGLPYKRALKSLMAEFLQRFIQDNTDGGHDSLEDSCACMELMLWRVKSDLQKTTRRVSGER